MNPRGILMLMLLVVVGSGQIMSQIEAGKAVPLGVAKVAAVDDAKIKAGRAIQISIEGVPAEEKARIDALYPVSKEGMVNLPYIGKIKAAGRSGEELKGDIEKAYVDAKIFKAPKITVIADNIGDPDNFPLVHTGGQVRKPGPIDFVDGMTIGDAIQAAGGATEFGSLERVKIYRNGKMTAYDITKGENRAMPLKKNDTIEVPQKNWFGK